MVRFGDTATEIMYSYLLIVGFIGFIFMISGQNLFGEAFPKNPLTSTTFSYLNTCSISDWICNLGYFFSQFISLLEIPFLILTYIWSIFIFFITSPTYFWLGIIFVPAGVIILILLVPLLTKILEIIVGIMRAIAEAIPF